MDHYYQILGLENRLGDAISAADLRQAYRQALLLHHPDKQTTRSDNKDVPSVDTITLAYKTLLDPKLRQEYDRELKSSGDAPNKINTRHTGMETIDLEELEMNEDADVWTRPCRCGSRPAFVVTEAELDKNVEYGELITGCKGCSLWLKVLFSVED